MALGLDLRVPYGALEADGVAEDAAAVLALPLDRYLAVLYEHPGALALGVVGPDAVAPLEAYLGAPDRQARGGAAVHRRGAFPVFRLVGGLHVVQGQRVGVGDVEEVLVVYFGRAFRDYSAILHLDAELEARAIGWHADNGSGGRGQGVPV